MKRDESNDEPSAPLDSLLGTTPPLTQFLACVASMTTLLATLHREGLLHRALRPASFLVNRTFQASWADDVDVTRAIPDATLTIAPVADELLPYMSPEHTRRTHRPIDARSDLYGLGVVFYHFFAGRLPFDATDPLSWMHCHLARPPGPLPEDPQTFVVRAILYKLLAKDPDERYQTARALLEDLETCRQALESVGQIEPFKLGRHDSTGLLRISRKLYGREEETARYLAAFERVKRGDREVVLFAGYSGIGKSALVHEIDVVLAKERGYFCWGKFDQQNRGIPYSAFLQAFGRLLQQVLSEAEEEIAAAVRALREALGANVTFLARLLPDIGLLLGPDAKSGPPDNLSPSETQHRLLLAFRGLLWAFSSRSLPVCVFVDDLQWADAGSMWLFEGLLTGESLGPCLIVGAYRDNEVDDAHPLYMTLRSVRTRGIAVESIELSNLSIHALQQFIADTLEQTPAEVLPLARLVMRKTQGNPFFVGQFLRALHADGLLTRSSDDGRFLWNVEAIEARSFTDNVIELMSARVDALAPETRESVKLAACIGNTFDLDTLSAIAGVSPEELAIRLRPAFEQEYILGNIGDIGEITFERAVKIQLRFMHDRVQQASYELIAPEQRRELHLQIGRRLLAQARSSPTAERIFEMAGHFECGADLLDDPVEGLRIAELHLSAALLAKQATAYSAARRYLRAGMRLLPPDAPTTNPAVVFGLLRQLADVEYLLGASDEAEALLVQALSRATSVLERVEVLKLRSVLRAMKMSWIEAADAGCEALAAAGVLLPPRQTPDDVLDRHIAAETAEIERLLAGRSIRSLVDAEECLDETHRRVIGVFSSLVVTLYVARLHKLNLLACSIMARLSLERGLAPDGYPFGMYGTMITHFGNAERGYEWSVLGVEVSRRFGRQADLCRGCFNLAVNVQHWVKPLAEGDSVLREGYRAALDGGEIQFGGYILIYLVLNPLFRGANAEKLIDEVPGYLVFSRRTSHKLATDCFRGQILILRELMGNPDVLPEEKIDEEKYIEACRSEVLKYALCVYMISKTMCASLHGDSRKALEYAAEAHATIDTIPGKFQAAALVFYEALAIIAVLSGPEDAETERLSVALAGCREKLSVSSRLCPANFAHKHALIEAEAARMEGHFDKAARHYDDAIQLAREHEFVNVEAMACEYSGRFWMGRGRARIGLDYLHDSLAAYRNWGAKHKVSLLQAEFPGLEPAIQKGGTLRPDAFDIEAVLKAARVLSRQIVLPRLLGQMVQVLMENAGAERGTLVLVRDTDLVLVARGDGHSQEYSSLPSQSLAEHEHEVCATAIRLASRTETVVISADAMLDPVLRKDRYVSNRGVRSLLCAPISHAGRLLGVIHLENNVLPGLFAPDRVEIVQLLAAQAAVSLENALVYEEMEKLVEDRTQKLRAAQEKLVDAARQAGRADIASGAIHNVGNALNSVVVLRSQIHQRTRTFRVDRLTQLVELLEKNRSGLATFFETDPRGQRVIPYIKELAGRMTTDRDTLLAEISELGHCVERIQEIVTNQLQDKGAPLIIEHVNLAHVVQSALDVALSSVERRRLEIEVNVDVPGNLAVETDRYRLLQILTNIMTNARKAVQRGVGLSRVVSVKCGSKEDGAFVISVADNGVGISVEHAKRLFQQGFTTWGDGTGIGLHSSALEAQHIGAKLRASSDGPGLGACFTIELPPRPPHQTGRWKLHALRDEVRGSNV